MTQAELKKLKRGEMLSLLLKQQRELESMRRELDAAREKLEQRREGVRKAGSAAEARAAMRTAFEDAWNAATDCVDRFAGVPEDESDEGEDPEIPGLPTSTVIQAVIDERVDRERFQRVLRSTVFILLSASAVAILVAVLLLPVLQIYGSSMNPTLYEGDYILSVKGSEMKTGDIVAFYYNNKILTKRVIGQAGQWIDIAEDGTVYVDNVPIEEPYLVDKAFGECDLELPYQVPESRIFVMGDNRSVSVDSRSTTIGCVAEEQIVGKIVFCIWPLSHFGSMQ